MPMFITIVYELNIIVKAKYVPAEKLHTTSTSYQKLAATGHNSWRIGGVNRGRCLVYPQTTEGGIEKKM